MALTPEQRAKLQALTSGQQPSVLTDEQRAGLGGGTSVPPFFVPPKQDGVISRAASAINRGVEKFANLPGVRQVGQLSGGVLGAAGGVIGGAVGAIGNPIANIAQGRPLFENFGEDVKRTARDTARFNYAIGEQAPTVGVMQTLGRAPNLVLGAAQTIEGYKQTKDALDRGDREAAIQAGITTGIGAAGTLLGLKQKGFLIDEAFSTGAKARLKGVSTNELNTQRYERVMQDVLQPNKSSVKRETKGILSQARKERAGMSVEPQKTTARVLVEEGVIPNTVDEGGTTKFRTAEQVVDMDNRVAYANSELEKALALDPNPQFDLQAKKEEATRSVDGIQNVSATEKKAMRAEIERFFDDEIEARGQFVDGLQYNQIKRGFANAGDYKNLTPGQRHMRQVAESIASDIETRYADKFNVKEVNRTIGDYIRARNELQLLDGSVVKGGGLSRKLAQLGGAIVGGPLSNIPLVDNIIGGYLAGKAQSYAVSPARKLSGLETANIQSPAVGVVETAREGALAAAARQASVPRLPAPREPLPDALAQYVPSESRVLSQAEARAALGMNRANPEVAIQPPAPKTATDTPTTKELAQIRRINAEALRQQIDQFNYPTQEMESGYKAFKNLADRSKDALDDALDADAFVKKYGKGRAEAVIEGAARGGGMTNNELLDAYRLRYRTEKSVKSQIERMKSGQPQAIPPEEAALFALAPLGGIQVTYDENGKPQYSFDAEQSVGSVALVGGILAAKKKGVLPRSGKPPKIDIPTQQEMVEVIDYARLKPGFNAKMEYQAALLAEKYGVQAKTLAEMANKFEDILVKIKGQKGYPSIRKKSSVPPIDKHTSQLMEEARSAGSLEDFIAAQEKKRPSYAMGHRPTKTGATVDDVSQNKSDYGLPKDFYEHPEFYEDVEDMAVRESLNAIRKARGNPNAEVTIYRAAPANEFNYGDWVSLSKKYAERESAAEGTRVHSIKAKAKDVHFAGDSINEFGYYPDSELAEVWKKVRGTRATTSGK